MPVSGKPLPATEAGAENTAIMSDSPIPAPATLPEPRHTPALPPALRWLRVIGVTEGVSTLALFGVAMPLKYGADMPMAVSVVGSIHGGLFVLYALTILLVIRRFRWPLRRGFILVAAAIMPFGPFILDRRIPAWHAADADSGGR